MTKLAAREDTAQETGGSRWILDKQRPAAPEAAPVADQVAPRRSVLRSLGSWIMRSLLTIVFVAALVAAGMAVTAAFTAREASDHARSDLAAANASLETVRAELKNAQQELAQARADDASAAAELETAKTRRDELQLESDLLRRMLLESKRGRNAG